MIMAQAEFWLGMLVAGVVVFSLPTRVRSAGDCALALLPLALAWLFPIDLRGTSVILALELAATLLLYRALRKHDRRLPIQMMAFALIASVAEALSFAFAGPMQAACRTIATGCWAAATIALAATFVSNLAQARLAPGDRPASNRSISPS